MSVYIPVELRHQLRQRFRDCCAYCRTAENLSVVIFEMEHIVPRSRGGKTEFGNLCILCPTCNRYKSDLSAAPDPLTGELARLFHPQEQRWTEHFSWNADFTEINGLTSTGRATVAALRMNRPQLVRARRMWVTMQEHPPKHLQE
jgi:HNH endonuclease